MKKSIDVRRQYVFTNTHHHPTTPMEKTCAGSVECKLELYNFTAEVRSYDLEGLLSLSRELKKLSDEMVAYARENIHPMTSVWCDSCFTPALQKNCPQCVEALDKWKKKFDCY